MRVVVEGGGGWWIVEVSTGTCGRRRAGAGPAALACSSRDVGAAGDGVGGGRGVGHAAAQEQNGMRTEKRGEDNSGGWWVEGDDNGGGWWVVGDAGGARVELDAADTVETDGGGVAEEA